MSTPLGATAPSDVLERRTVTLAAVVALVMVLETGTFGVALFGISTWSVAFYVAALAAEVASLVLCSALLVPEDVRQRLPAGLRRPVPASERRGELFFWAFCAVRPGARPDRRPSRGGRRGLAGPAQPLRLRVAQCPVR